MTHSFVLKLERAHEHLNAFNNEATAWINTEPYGIVDEPDPESPLELVSDGYNAKVDYQFRRFRIDSVRDTPSRLDILVGECVFNLRSALDHLAFALANSFTVQMTDEQRATSEFPVFSEAKHFRKSAIKKIGCISPVAQAIIEGLQPYHRHARYLTHPLWHIHELNRIDKHRHLTPCTTWPSRDGQRTSGFKIHGDENIGGIGYVHVASTKVELNSIIMRYSMYPSDPDKQVCLHPNVSSEIVFGDGSVVAGKPVIPLLQSLCNFVGDIVVPQLSKFL